MNASEIIKKYIKENGIQQSFVAKKIGMSRELFRRSIEGTRVLKADEFIKICTVLSIDLDLFFKSKQPA